MADRPIIKDCWGYLRYGRFWRMPREEDARAICALDANRESHALARIIDGVVTDASGKRFYRD